ncbi:MAG: MltA domain-containing protein [Desulfobacterales bacterium]|nr:MltA domain-containing protein [Desulfobacterales bacterium]
MTRRTDWHQPGPGFVFHGLLSAVLLVALWVLPDFVCAQMAEMPPSRHPVFADDLDYGGLSRAIGQTIAYYEKLPSSRRMAYGPDTYAVKDLISGLRRFQRFVEKKPSAEAVKKFLQENARVYAHMEQSNPVSVLFTGYYEPVIKGSREKTDLFQYPVYGRPKDLVVLDLAAFDTGCDSRSAVGRLADDRVVPYYDRRTIDTTDVLASSADVIAWAADPVELFFLHVQGSGRIRFQSGEEIGVRFDITNGRPYKSIGQYLIDKDKIDRRRMSMQAIAAYLEKHPEEIQEVLFSNPRYVFFKKSRGGPKGSLGVDLTPGRSVALDRDVSPPGALLFICAKKPADKNAVSDKEAWIPFSRFACSQDTGSAITGQKRADLFWGSGDHARAAAGHMQHRGRIYYLVILN